jgi:hypothetical protein
MAPKTGWNPRAGHATIRGGRAGGALILKLLIAGRSPRFDDDLETDAKEA